MNPNRKTFAQAMPTARPLKIMINVGACMDIPTGRFIKGKHGESILNGGLANLTGVVGMGNTYKSTTMHYMLIAAQARIFGSFSGTYDTEMNIQEWRLQEMADNVRKALDLEQEEVIAEGTWAITDRSKMSGNVWYEHFRDFMKDKINNPKDWMVTTPFMDRDGNNLKIALPTYTEIDSFSEFTTDAVEKIQDDAQIGESGQNMVSMKQGQNKSQFLMSVPGLAVGSDSYVLMTAHIGQEYQLDPRTPPKKKLADLDTNTKIKGVPEKFTFITQNCWLNKAGGPLLNQATKEPEFPRDENDDKRGDTDVKIVNMKQLRGKAGPTGIYFDVMVSQNLGVLPSMTEFYNIKEKGRFGIEGSLQSYYLTIYPDAKMSRKTIRSVVSNDKKLRRALNITSELCQMHEFWFHMTDVLLTPEELYTKIKEQGYDWNFILEHTRGWWALEEDTRPIGLFLSTMDLLLMAKGEYTPYWLEDKKDMKVKKEYLHLMKSQVKES